MKLKSKSIYTQTPYESVPLALAGYPKEKCRQTTLNRVTNRLTGDTVMT